ncbi:MAG TPA: TonB-dependent receptor [Puia sp.]|jgi:iron complex outermembrane receptor protein|nr:TonB-dependent receptor [Puia sp.]
MKRLLILACLICYSLFLHAQSTLSGKVTDKASGAGLSGVSIKVKGTKRGVSTGNDGIFSLQVNHGDILIISSIGYSPKEMPVPAESYLTIPLEILSANLEQFVFVGSRGAARSKTESPVPVDVINVNGVGQTTAKPDLMSQLNMTVPSFNYNKQSGGDGSDAIDFASLRGLGFDQTLVLINGKRQHLSAFVNEVGTRGRGNSGYDLNAIPEAAIDRIEILRDGASAQYGSDAIAGVINIILKKNINHLNVSIGTSAYDDHKYNSLNAVDPTQFYTGSQLDGQSVSVGMDYGLPIGQRGGFINLGANFMSYGKTYRAVRDTNISTNANALPIDIWRRAFGDGSVVSGGGMYNMEVPVSTSTTFYSFGGYNYKHSNVYAWTRSWGNPNRSQPTKFPTDANGNLLFVPGIMRVYDPAKGVLDTNNVYYNPQEDVYIKDASVAVGFRGTIGDGWSWDLSNNLGYNDFHYWGNKTFNASLLPYADEATKTRFDDGGFSFTQNTTNLDFSKHFSSIAAGVTLSFGGEFRYERYHLYAGELDSYLAGGATLGPGGPAKASGSEGYPGYQPGPNGDASLHSRTNTSGYVDLALDVTKAWLVDIAERFENYSDFGFVATQKVATRYKITENFNIRGSVSTGFRAPTLQQLDFSNTNTNIINGNLVYSKLVPNYSNIARAAGIPKLTQETSTNVSLGFTWQPVRNLTVTADAYSIQIKNRIVISGQYAAGDATLGTALNDALNAQGIQYAQFFANAVNTRNNGLDLVLDYNYRWLGNHFRAVLAGNIQGIRINKINVPPTFSGSASDSANFFSDREQYFLKASAPRSKFSLNLEYGKKMWAIGTHLTYFGSLSTLGFGETATPAGSPDPFFPYVTLDATGQAVPEIFHFSGKVTTDLYASYNLTKNATLTLGVDNLFNVHPDKSVVPGSVSLATGSSSWGDSESGGPFDAVQMGFDGTRLFAKLIFNF